MNLTKEQRQRKAWLKYHFGRGNISFAAYHKGLLPLYEKNK